MDCRVVDVDWEYQNIFKYSRHNISSEYHHDLTGPYSSILTNIIPCMFFNEISILLEKKDHVQFHVIRVHISFIWLSTLISTITLINIDFSSLYCTRIHRDDTDEFVSKKIPCKLNFFFFPRKFQFLCLSLSLWK